MDLIGLISRPEQQCLMKYRHYKNGFEGKVDHRMQDNVSSFLLKS